jgi:hypothetical protein
MTVRGEIVRSLPLAVRGVEVTDPVITVFGDEWSLTVMCPWVLTGPEDSISWESEQIEDKIWDLIGLSIVSVSATDPDVTDPVFHFEGGFELAIHADTDIDPWSLALPQLVVVGRAARRPESGS